SLVLKWQKVHYTLGTARHSVLAPIIDDSGIFTFANMRDTSRKDVSSGLGYKIIGHLRRYSLNGNLLDSLIIVKGSSSNDSLTDATSDSKGNVYTVSLSKDSGKYNVLVSLVNSRFEIEKQALIGENPLGN